VGQQHFGYIPIEKEEHFRERGALRQKALSAAAPRGKFQSAPPSLSRGRALSKVLLPQPLPRR